MSNDVKEMMETMSEQLPGIFKALCNSIYSEETAKQMGHAVGVFYKELVSAGMNAEQAYQLSKEYLNALHNMNKGVQVTNS